MSGHPEHRAYLSLGGNLGDPLRAMATSLRMLDAEPSTRVIVASSVYLTPPWGQVNQPHFHNAAAEVLTTMSARELLSVCLGIENALKRIRTEPGGPRSIDLDVLWYEGQSYREPGLDVPHPRMLQRGFVLLPLSEIAPGLVLEGEPIQHHLDRTDREGFRVVVEGSDWWRA